MTKLLISGSRKATPKLLHYVHFIVTRAKANGFHVICEDADGVGSQCWHSCQELEVPYTVYGIADKPRNDAPIINFEVVRPARTYEQRDETMVDMADKVMCIWNSKIKSKGTVRVVKYARDTGKEFWLYGEWKQKGIRKLNDELDEIIAEVLK